MSREPAFRGNALSHSAFMRSKAAPDSDRSNASDNSTIAHDRDSERFTEIGGEKNGTRNGSKFLTRGKVLFFSGIILGTALGLAMFQPTDMQELQTYMSLFMSERDLTLPQLPELDFSRLEAEWSRLRMNIPEIWKFNNDGREFQVGDAMKARGLSAKYPVVLIPGVISTGLESWSTAPEYRPFFKQRLWGGLNMISQVMFNRDKWMNAMILDTDTGLDPPGAKIRAAEGIDAATSFVQGYWIWSKIVENLAVVNYDTNNLYLAPYDWRLSYYNLEERDGYFSKLKQTIEGLKLRQKKKIVIAAHSMGCSVLLYFFKWVESPQHGGGGSSWVEDHIEAYISIAGTHLGVVKSMAAFLSGEMKDTVQMNPAGAYVLEHFFSRNERRKLFHSWAGSASMWMKGGNAVWGNETFAPDDRPGISHSHGELIAFRQTQFNTNSTGLSNMTADEASTWILRHTPIAFQKMMSSNYSFGMERDEIVLKQNDLDHTKWTNPLEVRLPNAPSMKIYCVYGHGKETERSYWYAVNDADSYSSSTESVCEEDSEGQCANPNGLTGSPPSKTTWIDAAYTDENMMPKVRNGVRMGEGDGTVNLLSLGAMCVEGWKRPRWNPSGIKITTIELPHNPIPSIPRGGANTSDHVDVLGSNGLNEIILKVATGIGHELKDSFVSNIREYARLIRWD